MKGKKRDKEEDNRKTSFFNAKTLQSSPFAD